MTLLQSCFGLKVEKCGYFTLPATKRSLKTSSNIYLLKNLSSIEYMQNVSQRRNLLWILYFLVIINMLFVVVEILAQVVHISYFQTSYIFEKKCLPVQCFPFLVSPVAVQHWLFKRIVTTPIIYLIFWGSLTLVAFFLDSHNLIKHICGQF